MNVIDMHLHLDESIKGGAKEAMKFLSDEMLDAQIERGLLLHLNVHRFGIDEVSHALLQHKNIIGFVNIDPCAANADKTFRDAIASGAFKGLKLHPRLNGYLADDPRVMALFKLAGELGVPTLVDAFPDGNSLMLGDNPDQYGRLALSSPSSPLIVAHFGGHKVIDMMLIAKRIPNIYVNIAYTLLYYRGSSITSDLIYAIKSMRGERIFYGSDYPDRPLGVSLELTRSVFEEFSLNQTLTDKVLHSNANNFIKKYNL